jgi:dihydrofolate reductase
MRDRCSEPNELVRAPNADGWWGDEAPFHHPVFVLTHHARERRSPNKTRTTFTFVTDGIEAALEEDRAAAGDKNVAIAGGANVVQQHLRAGLDELQIHLVPVLLGDGVRPFEDHVARARSNSSRLV